MINNAGIGGPAGPIWENDPQEWWRTFDVNLRGVFNYLHCVLPHMISRKSGAIFNIGSFVGIRPTPMVTAYCVSKTALARLTDSVAPSVAEFGIGVFCISPGLVKTDMTRDLPVFGALPASAWSSPDKICEQVVNILSTDCSAISGRFLHAEDDLDAILSQADRVEADGLFQLGMHGLDGRIE